MSAKIGRNDPCHCGSGKKYKKCHLALDEQRQTSVHLPEPPPAPVREPAPSKTLPPLPSDPKQMASFLRDLVSQAPVKERATFKKLLAETEPVLEYLEQREAIAAAIETMEAHREELDSLVEDKEAYLSRTRALFAEERFVPFRFTAADIKRAFKQVGYTPGPMDKEQMVKKVLAAILHLADPDYRRQISRKLQLLLPDYVKEERYVDAWLILNCAYLTLESTKSSNPFLFAMFSYGYDAWMDEQQASRDALLQLLGVDPEQVQKMSLEEVDAWMDKMEADPDFKARVEAAVAADPEQRAQAIAYGKRMEQEFVKLLNEREDAHTLLLSREEIQPWILVLSQRWESAVKTKPELAAQKRPTKASDKALADFLMPLLEEMTQVIFTPERIQQMVSQLKQYRGDLFTADHKGAAASVLAAISSLERAERPAENYYLIMLCHASIGKHIKMMTPATAAHSVAPADEE